MLGLVTKLPPYGSCLWILKKSKDSAVKKFARQFTLAMFALVLCGACTTLSTPTFSDESGAIRGYDPVAYHLQGEPVKGSPEFATEYNGATWYFSSDEHRDLFENDPEKFAPQYGGYCAYAMSKNFVVSIDPNAWKIVDDKLYLNYSPGVRRTWLKDIPGYVEKADANWQNKISQPEFK